MIWWVVNPCHLEIVLRRWKICKSTTVVDLHVHIFSDTRMIVKDSYVGNACNELLPRVVLQELPNSTRIEACQSGAEASCKNYADTNSYIFPSITSIVLVVKLGEE